jgi:hypothetical protein
VDRVAALHCVLGIDLSRRNCLRHLVRDSPTAALKKPFVLGIQTTKAWLASSAIVKTSLARFPQAPD